METITETISEDYSSSVSTIPLAGRRSTAAKEEVKEREEKINAIETSRCFDKNC
jgi:hypothetical protein